MPDYVLRWSRQASKELDRIPRQLAERIYGRVGQLATLPRPPTSLKLKGSFDLWRLRVGDYRVLYAIQDAAKSIDILAVKHRKDAYRDL